MSPSCEVEHASLRCSGDVQMPKTLVVEFDLLMNKIASVFISSSSSKIYKVHVCGDCIISTKQL